MGSCTSKNKQKEGKVKEDKIQYDPHENPDEYWKMKQYHDAIYGHKKLAHLIEECIIRGKYEVLEWYCFNEIYETKYWTRKQFKDALLTDQLVYSNDLSLINMTKRAGKLSALRILGIYNSI